MVQTLVPTTDVEYDAKEVIRDDTTKHNAVSYGSGYSHTNHAGHLHGTSEPFGAAPSGTHRAVRYCIGLCYTVSASGSHLVRREHSRSFSRRQSSKQLSAPEKKMNRRQSLRRRDKHRGTVENGEVALVTENVEGAHVIVRDVGEVGDR